MERDIQNNVLDIKEFREACESYLYEAADTYSINMKAVGFDSNHVHIILDLGKYSEPYVRKILKGITGHKLLQQFPNIKRKYFWESGLWGRQYYCYGIVSDMKVLNKYVQKQKFFTAMHHPEQMTLESFHTTSL